jgi:uncharacterized protein
MALSDGKYMSFTTYKKDGTAVASPVWVIDAGDGKLGFWTASVSGKAKRLKNNNKVLVQPSNGRGKVVDGTTPTDATAEVLDGGPRFDDVTAKIKAKYGFQAKLTRFIGTLVHKIKRKPFQYGDRVIVVTPTVEAPTA